MAGEPVSDEVVPGLSFGFLFLPLPAAEIEAVARPRHGDIEEAMVLLVIGLPLSGFGT
jgi:hypothetical protein